ncbi:MAG TPA: dienelactone hydrolase family protein [Acidimicrobiia bacterium]|nr:dienelactone hydrolase family protein [Acidimicrobiia bacterium]
MTTEPETRAVELATADGPMACYEARPSGEARGGVIVIQEAFGVNDHIEDVTRRFASAGYHAVAPHLFHRAGGGTAPYGDFAKVIPLYEGLTDDGIRTDVDAARDHLHAATLVDDQIGIVGFCFGGRVTFLVALEHALGAAVGFYGGGIVTPRFPQFPGLIDRVGELKTPWLGLFGDRDESIPVEDVEKLRGALTNAPVPTEIVRYPDAEHGFHCDVRESYNPDAAKDAWTRTLVWFDQHLADGGR